MRKNILIFGHNDATQFIDIFNQYTRLFDKNKYEVTVAYLTGEPNEETRQRTIAENVIFLNLSKKSIRGLKINPIKKLLSICKEKNFQLVICHRYKPTYIMLWVAQFCRIPALIFVMHELRTMSALSRQLVIAALFRKNMLFAGVSDAVRNDMRRNLWCVPDHKIITLYNMIDIELTEPQLLSREDARQALKIPTDAFVFGNLARLAVNKDHSTLIHAFSLIKPDCPNAKLIIMGDGELEAALKKQVATYGLTDSVIFTGYLPVASRYMKAFDCFVLSSIQEAFGRVLLEAMIAKLPVIATRVDGIPEVVGNEGILVNSRDAVMFADAMKKIYHSTKEELAMMGDKGYRHTRNNFSIPKFNEHFWQLPFIQSIKA